MAPETTRASLLSRLRKDGDEESWREFDRSYHELVLRYARRRGLQTEDAEDVRQAVMVRLAKSLPGFRYDPSVGRFRDYLRRFVHNEVVRLVERNARAAEGAGDALEELAGAREDGGDELWEAEWRAHHLRRAMARAESAFDPETLGVFARILAGESPEAIAAGRGTSVGAVHKAKQRVRDYLSERVAEQVAREEFEERADDAGQ